MFVIAGEERDLDFMVGVSSGIYMAARSPELGSIVRKLGFTLTRGTRAVELAADVPHEIDYTQGKELRYIAEKQNMTLLFHGSLTVPIAMPERGEWRDAQNHLQKSIKSAVMGGCKYVNFHSCLNFWLEMMTYSGRKLTMAFCDHEGNFIGQLLAKDKDLREWFVKRKWDVYGGDILLDKERVELSTAVERQTDEMRRETIAEKVMNTLGKEELQDDLEDNVRRRYRGTLTEEQIEREMDTLKGSVKDQIVERMLTAGVVPGRYGDRIKEELEKAMRDAREFITREAANIRRENFQKVIMEKLSDASKKWDSEELRAVVGIIDGYHIMAHYLYYTNDPIWQAMVEMYRDVIESDKYKKVKYYRNGAVYEYDGIRKGTVPKVKIDEGKEAVGENIDETDYWLDAAWERAERENDREFKEFYYAVCAAKFIEGHISKTLEWMKSEEPEGLMGILRSEAENDEQFQELKKAAEELKITLEIPDARSAEYAGLYLMCRPKQIYAAVKTIQETVNTDKILMLIDFEHIATQGFDAHNEISEFVRLAEDAGKYILSLHVTKPSPLHHHIQVEIGDVEVYRLLWQLTEYAGLGAYHRTYLIYERGGEKDPYKQSVTALRLMVEQLKKGTSPEELISKPEFFGVESPTIASKERQRVIISEHTEDPLEGLTVVPEESYSFLGRAATEKVGAEKWKKEELT